MSKTNTPKDFKVAKVAILGRPNAGKSTLLNALLESELSAVSKRPQTTRQNIRGVVQLHKSKKWTGQLIFVDTPGLNFKKGLLDRHMFSSVEEALRDVDVVLWLSDLKSIEQDLQDLEKSRPGSDHIPGWLANQMEAQGEQTWILVLTEADRLDKAKLLPVMERVAKNFPQIKTVVPIASILGLKDKNSNLDNLLKVLGESAKAGEAVFSEDEWTDISQRDLIKNLVREAVFRIGREEVPYFTDCTIQDFIEPTGVKKKPEVHVNIWVSKKSIKPILVGKGGANIKEIGTNVRKRFQDITGDDLVLKLFVKVVEDWTEEKKLVEELGYTKA